MSKRALSILITTSLLFTNCGRIEPETSASKIAPLVIYGAISAAIEVAAAIRANQTGINQEHVRTIIRSIEDSKNEIINHKDQLFVQEWIASADALNYGLSRYESMRNNRDQLHDFLMKQERALGQLEGIFVNYNPSISYKAIAAYNSVAALRIMTLMDYTRDPLIVKDFVTKVIARNTALMSVPVAPGTMNAQGQLVMPNCKVFIEPYLVEIRAHILYSALKPWSGGYYKNHEFRIYFNGQLFSRCFEDNNGNGASPYPIVFINSWSDLAWRMYNESVMAETSSDLYKAVQKGTASLQAFNNSL